MLELGVIVIVVILVVCNFEKLYRFVAGIYVIYWLFDGIVSMFGNAPFKEFVFRGETLLAIGCIAVFWLDKRGRKLEEEKEILQIQQQAQQTQQQAEILELLKKKSTSQDDDILDILRQAQDN